MVQPTRPKPRGGCESSSSSDRSLLSIYERIVPPRRRTTTACDQCRRRKTKCNGKALCSACAVLHLECTYGQKVKQLRGPSYVAHLEGTIKELREQIDGLTTNTTYPSFETDHTANGSPEVQHYLKTLGCPEHQILFLDPPVPFRYGSCSGLEILRRIRLRLDLVIGRIPELYLDDILIRSLDQNFPSQPLSPAVFCPARDDLLYFVKIAFEQAFWCAPFVDESKIQAAIHRTYDGGKSEIAEPDQDEMALIYAVVTLGQYFDPSSQTPVNLTTARVDWKGMTYFQTTRSFIDLSNCGRSLTTLQTVVCLALYLVSASAITAAHAYVANAAAAALRRGLHLPSKVRAESEREQLFHLRTYQALKSLDTYIATFLGISCSLPPNNEEFELSPKLAHTSHDEMDVTDVVAAGTHIQTFPLAVLDSTRQAAFFNGQKADSTDVHYVQSSVIQGCNRKLDDWTKTMFSLNHIVPSKDIREEKGASLLGRVTGAYATLMVNSLFLHYLIDPSVTTSLAGKDAGAKCTAAAIEVVHVLSLFREELLLYDVHPPTFCLVFAANVLLLVELSGAIVPSIQQVKAASKSAEALLQELALRHCTALGGYRSLEPAYQMRSKWEKQQTDGALLGPPPLSNSVHELINIAPTISEISLDPQKALLSTAEYQPVFIDSPADTLHLWR